MSFIWVFYNDFMNLWINILAIIIVLIYWLGISEPPCCGPYWATSLTIIIAVSTSIELYIKCWLNKKIYRIKQKRLIVWTRQCEASDFTVFAETKKGQGHQIFNCRIRITIQNLSVIFLNTHYLKKTKLL